MTRFIAARLAQGVLVVVGASVVTFAMVFVAGDPTAAFAQPDWTQEQVAAFRREMGFDRPWLVQYARFLGGALRGQFGNSLRYHQPVFPLLLERLPATFELAGLALLISAVLGVPLGVLSAVRRDSLGDQVGMGLALVGQAFPTFWLGIMLILIFAVELRWLPISGRGTVAHAVLPALTLATYGLARNARLVRSSLLDVLGREFIRTAHAKGLAARQVISKHALRNALIPVITIIGLDVGSLLGGAVITETVFAWPGVGRLIVTAVSGRDLPMVQAVVLVLACIFVLINIAVDVGYAVLDPRLRYE